jgi:hypothetical protein
MHEETSLMITLRKLLVLLWCMVLPGLVLSVGTAQANEVQFEHHVVHYTVINTTFLSPDVARAYDVRRSSNRALVNIVVMQRGEEGMQSVPAALSGQAVNLNRQVRHLRFRMIRDGDAIYHLAEVPVRPGEELDFQIRILAEGSDQPLPLRFRQLFYRN